MMVAKDDKTVPDKGTGETASKESLQDKDTDTGREPADTGRAAADTVTETGQDAQPAGDPGQPERYEVAEQLDAMGSPYYQRAGQARQMANELHLLISHGSGDTERADRLRRELEALGHDPDAAAVPGPSGGPTGRETRGEQMIRADAGEGVQPASGSAASGGDVEAKPTPAHGSGGTSTPGTGKHTKPSR